MSSTPTAKRKGASPAPKRVKPGASALAAADAIASSVSTETGDRELIMIPLEKLHRHPDNREIDPASVAELVASLSDHGQREPIRVRPLKDPIGHYEILSGERRFVAAQQVVQPRMDALLAIVERHTAGQALVELAVANAARQDLNPIERGELLAKLIAPISEGGAGLERAAAGRVFGLNSDSGIKNALRLLNLPKFFRDLLASGQAPVNKVRPLCAYPNELLELFAKELQRYKYALQNFVRPDFDDSEEIDEELHTFIDQHTRPCDQHEYYMSYQVGRWPCLFNLDELTDKQRNELQVVEIPDRENKGKTRLVALNEKAWHKLQDPLAKAAYAKKQAGGKSKAKPVAAAKGEKEAPPTAAELKAKRKKADEQLQVYTRDWLIRALRCQLSQVDSWTGSYHAVMDFMPWLLANCYDCNSLGQYTAWAIAELLGFEKGAKLDRAENWHMAMANHDYTRFYPSLWRVILWPAATHNNSHPDLVLGSIPERLPGLRHVSELAAELGISAETVWEAARKESMQRALVHQWMTRHTKEQLVDLAKSLGHSLDDKDSRGMMVDKLLDLHNPINPLKLPAMIKKAGAK